MAYTPSLYVNVSMIRKLGMELPIQIWHLGQTEILGNIKQVFEHLNVRWVNADRVAQLHPTRKPLNGWDLKAYATLYSPFAEVIALDADSFPVRNLEFLFDTREYMETGALLWADPFTWLNPAAWEKFTGLPDLETTFPSKPRRAKCGFVEVESGQMVFDKSRCFRLLLTQRMINEYSDFYYRHFYGDKHTLQIAIALLRQTCTILDNGRFILNEGARYSWKDDRPLFEHRTLGKYSYLAEPVRSRFLHAKLHLKFIAELNSRWIPGFDRIKHRLRTSLA